MALGFGIAAFALRDAATGACVQLGDRSRTLEEQSSWYRRAHALAPASGAGASAAVQAEWEHRRGRDLVLAQSALQGRPCSPTAARLLGLALLDRELPAAHRAFDRSLRATNPHDRPRLALNIAICCIDAGHVDAALARFRQAIGERPDLAGQVLEAAYARVPSFEIVREAVPRGFAAGFAALAEVLLAHGDFHGRELALALARGEEPVAGATARVTVADGVRLSAFACMGGGAGGRCSATLRFDVESNAPTGAVVTFCCEGPGTPVHRSFEPAALPGGAFHWEFELDAPGRWDVSLQLPDQRTRVPLGELAAGVRAEDGP